MSIAALLADYQRHTRSARAFATKCSGLSSSECGEAAAHQARHDRDAQRCSIALREQVQAAVGAVDLEELMAAVAAPLPPAGWRL